MIGRVKMTRRWMITACEVVMFACLLGLIYIAFIK